MVTAANAPNETSAHQIWRKVEMIFRRADQRSRKLQPPDPKTYPTPLARNLAERAAKDQHWRNAQMEEEHSSRESETLLWRFWEQTCQIDAANSAFLNQLIAQGAWPLISRDGSSAAHDAIILVQHADNDLVLQERVLQTLNALVQKREAKGSDYAALFDRVALGRGRPQRYGTQFGQGKGNCAALRPTENPEELDSRRLSVGLRPIAEYAQTIAATFKSKICANLFEGQ